MFMLFEWMYGANSFVPIDLWPTFEGNVIVRWFFPDVLLGGHRFPFKSLLLSTSVLNVIVKTYI